MKLRQWEIERHISELLGREPEVFWAGRTRDHALLLWPHNDGFAFLQRGNAVAVSVHGSVSGYFEPCLTKISDDSITAAVNVIVRSSGLPWKQASACEEIADMFRAANEAS